MTSKHHANTTIAQNKRARFEYTIEEEFEAGLVLEGWEVKSLRAGRANIANAHVIIKHGEAVLLGAEIQVLQTTAVHTAPDPGRTRKLLLHRKQINQLLGRVERQGYTLVPLTLYWSKNRVKMRLALAKGKKQHDKRDAMKDRDWARAQERLMKKHR